MLNKEKTVEPTFKSGNDAKPIVTSSADTSWRKCKHCGQYLSYEQLEKRETVMHVFIPDTMFTVEESYFVHRHCW